MSPPVALTMTLSKSPRRSSAQRLAYISSPPHPAPPSGPARPPTHTRHHSPRSCRQVIIAGTSAYSRHIDYARMRMICDKVGACERGLRFNSSVESRFGVRSRVAVRLSRRR